MSQAAPGLLPPMQSPSGFPSPGVSWLHEFPAPQSSSAVQAVAALLLQVPPHTGQGRSRSSPRYVTSFVCIDSALLPESTLRVPAMFCANLVMRHVGTPPTDSGAGASAKHSQAAFPAHVPTQSLLLPHGALLLHRAWVPH